MSPIFPLLLRSTLTGTQPRPRADLLLPVRQDTLTVKEAKPGYRALAKVDSKTAMHTALAGLPGGKISSAELEKEHGRLVYSFDIAVPGKSGAKEVMVDATSGKVISRTHETALMEAKERKAK
jgi:hypothetical protein